MASAQWKNFQPSNQDGAMSTTYQRSSSFSKQSNSNPVSSSSNSSGPLRETGIIEKLLHSYGFIQCCEKQARLFFHFSQFCGNIDYLKVGDAVEFETTYDRKTGKPIAREVVKISPESLSDEVLSEERVSGLVTTEIKNGNEGRIAYENRGECFFLPYCNDDVDSSMSSEDVHFQSGDKVTFLISPDKQTGNPRARNVRLERPMPEKYQGCINSLKETFGFIERADVVKEIFFHASECKDFKNLNLGDDVAFNVQTRNNKEVATNVVCLPTGTVIFEDVSSEAVMGQVVKSIDRYQSRQATSELPGRIRYRRENKENEIQFGEKDTKGDFTLQNGDWVQFNMAVDRRDKLQRATNIELLDESFIVSGEIREKGVVAAVKDTYGFITYGHPSQSKRNNRGDSNRVFFRFSELLDPEHDLKLSDEVEFTVAQDPASPNRYHAIRIRNLPPGTIVAEPVSYNSSNHDDRSFGTPTKKVVGKVEKKPTKPGKSKQRKTNGYSQGSNSEEDDSSLNGDEYMNGYSDGYDGVITYHSNGETHSVSYSKKDYDRKNKPRVGDKVEFYIETVNSQDYARDIRLVGSHAVRNGFRFTHRGYIAALKDSFGFIETEEHDREIFFHFNVYDGNPSQLELGQEVEYGISNKGVKVSAEAVRKIQQGTIPQTEIKAEVLNGVITRPVRCFNPEQDDYSGLVTLTPDALPDLPEELLPNGDEHHSMSTNFMDRPVYEFGITSLEDKHDFLQKGDAVQFQIGLFKIDGELKERAMRIRAIRTKLQAIVEAIHGNFGFLSHEVEDGKKLFFHMSEVKGGDILQTGDRVEFVLMHNQRTGKHSACSVVKIGEVQPTQRPERLLNRLRTVSLDEGPKVIVIRQPKGPDGSGFKNQRNNSVSSNHASSNGISASINQEILLNGQEHVHSGLNVEAPIFGMSNEKKSLHHDPNNSFECQHNQQISA